MCVIEESHRGADRSPSSCARKDELRPGYYSRVRIVRHGGDADEMVKPGEAGELIVDASAETFFSGYLNRPDATAEKLRNGWYFTGDVCVMHENGDMDLVGRVDDVIRSGGEGQMTKNPWKEAFLSSNIKYILIATVVLIGQGVVWYSGQFWALYFLQQVSKVDPLTSAYIVGAALLIATPSLIFFGWLSDFIGRKPVILGGMLLAAITYYPLYSWLGTVTQPGNINYPIAVFIIFILVCYVGMVYGPVGAFLAEFFPGRIRYTSVVSQFIVAAFAWLDCRRRPSLKRLFRPFTLFLKELLREQS